MSLFSGADQSPVQPSIAILRALRVLVADGQTFEVRAPKALMPGRDRPTTELRRFGSRELAAAARYAARLSGHAPGTYVTMNPLRDGIPEGQAARDADVLRRTLLLLDVDPARPADTSSTDDEKAAAWRTIEAIRDYLTGQGWPAPIVSDSGNGFHALYRIDLPADDGGLAKRVLESLAARFDDESAKVDTKVANPSRICKLPGTLAAKGESTAERPHRFARLLSVPDPFQVVRAEQLEAIAADVPQVPHVALDAEIDPKRAQRERRPREKRGNRPDAETRASAYLARCEPAISGSGGHDQTFKVAVNVGPGFDLAPDVAYRLLTAEYNPRCEPPWSERELRHKVDEAYRVETRRGWLLEATAPASENGNGRHGPPPPNAAAHRATDEPPARP